MSGDSKVSCGFTLYNDTYIQIVSKFGRFTRNALGHGVSPKKKRIRNKKLKQICTVALHMYLEEVGCELKQK